MGLRNYTVSERAIIAIGAAAGKSTSEVNEVLLADAKKSGATFRPANETSFGMAGRYPSIQPAEAKALWDHIIAPKSLGDL